jgi:energy-coupling factor transporter ATP-binding protein EcfA2
LSGGEKQLVAMATVLALEPAIIVYDDSLAMLDELAAERVIAVMQKLKQRGTTQVIIDHTLKGINVYDKVFVLEAGRIIRRGARDLVLGEKEFLREHDILL